MNLRLKSKILLAVFLISGFASSCNSSYAMHRRKSKPKKYRHTVIVGEDGNEIPDDSSDDESGAAYRKEYAQKRPRAESSSSSAATTSSASSASAVANPVGAGFNDAKELDTVAATLKNHILADPTVSSQ